MRDVCETVASKLAAQPNANRYCEDLAKPTARQNSRHTGNANEEHANREKRAVYDQI
jgi:hypothetical protein